MIQRRMVVLGLGAAAIPLMLTSAPGMMPATGHRDWADRIGMIRLAVVSGHDNAARVAKAGIYAGLLEQTFALPVTIGLVPDYDAMITGLVERRVDLAYVSPAVYSAAWALSDGNVIPLVAVRERDGTPEYRAVMVVRADSPVRALADMRGRSLGWADPRSASGYLVPRAAFMAMGLDPTAGRFFGETMFAGGHEAGVLGVLAGKWDAAFAWVSGQGDPMRGFTRGSLRIMVDGRELNAGRLRMIWTSPPLMNGPLVVRADTPAGFRDDMLAFHLALAHAHPDVMAALDRTSRADAGAFVRVRHDDYAPVLELIARPPRDPAGNHAGDAPSLGYDGGEGVSA